MPSSAQRRGETAPTIARRLRPTSRAWGLIFAGAIAIVVAYLIGRIELLGIGAFLVALPLLALLIRTLLRPRVELERTVFPRSLAVGDRLRVVSELRNRSILPLEPASYLDLTPGAGKPAIGGVLPAIASRWHRNDNRRRRRIAYSLASLRRGVHAIGPLYLENVDGLGLTRRVIEVGEAVPIEVWPRIHDLDELDMPATRSGGEVEAGLAIAGDSDDVLTRDYRRGDPMRRVHWKATARSGELRVRQEEHHAEVASLVVLDTGPSLAPAAPPAPTTAFELMDAPGDQEAAQVDPVFEQAVSVAASLIARLHDMGYETDYYETRQMADGSDDPRIGGARVAAEESLEPIMRHLMLAAPATAEAERADAIDDLLARSARLGHAPIFLVHRVAAGRELERLLELGVDAQPAVCLMVVDGAAPAVDARRIAAMGWDVALLDARAADPWATMRRVEAPATAGGAR